MSCQITLNNWSGKSKTEAAKKLAKVFKLNFDKSASIVDHICNGLPWRFDQPISDEQADTASTYLSSLGFVVDIKPIEGKVEMLYDDVINTKTIETEQGFVPENSCSFKFQGDGSTLLNIIFVNLTKVLFTIGIYSFWAKTNVRQYIWGQTLFVGEHFSYQGTAKELLKGSLMFGGIIVLLGLINIYIIFNIGPEEGQQFFQLVSLFTVFMIPVFLVGAWRYRLSRTTWRDIRFSFQGKKRDACILYIKGAIVSILTLGLYWPFFKMNNEKFWRENSRFGNAQFGFSGAGKDFFGKYIIAVFLTPFTLGFYLFWFIADLKRYLWSHTHFGEATFHFSIKGKDYMKLKLINFFILLITLGVGFPYTMIRNQKFFTENLVLDGKIELNRIEQEVKTSGAFGEETAEHLEKKL